MSASTAPYRLEDLTSTTVAVLRAAGMADQDADLLAASLVEAEASGVVTHGLARLKPYLTQLRSGQVAVRPEETDIVDGPARLLIDAGGGYGAPVGARAVDRLVAKARTSGVAVGGVRRVAHVGAVAFFTRRAASQGCLALAMSSSSASVVPFGGRGPRIGNSPMSFAAPGPEGPLLVADMAQSTTSRGRIALMAERGEQLPDGWAIDAEGRPTTDPAAALAGAVLPSGGHKGSAMSLVVEMLASGLTGANLTRDIVHAGFTSASPAGGAGGAAAQADVSVGATFLLIDAEVFGDAEGVRARALAIAEHVRASEPAPGVPAVLAPGDPEATRLEQAHRDGVHLSPSTTAALAELTAELGLPAPSAISAPVDDDEGDLS